MGAIIFALQSNPCDLLIYESGVLPRAEVVGVVNATRKYKVIEFSAAPVNLSSN
jgi:hypothetical protein